MARNVQRVSLPGTRVLPFGKLDAGAFIFVLAVAAVAIMVLLPLAWLLYMSLQIPAGKLGLANYVTAFTQSIYLAPILNSLILATSVAAIATAIGTPLAWLVARTDLPARGLLRALVIAAFVTPPFLGAQAWMLLAAPHSGWLNRAIVALTGADQGPFNIYSLAGAVFVMASYNIPYTFTFVAGALAVMPSELEDAAAILGSGSLATDAYDCSAFGAARDHRADSSCRSSRLSRSSERRLFF